MGNPIIATYRIQMRREFDFDSAAGIAPYLEKLGISHVYASPYLQAAPGSTHGYDVVNHKKINEELGGEKGFDWFCRMLGKHNIGQILDIVPNHMAITGPENEWWWDVLENGPSSQYASYFDVDWDLPAGHGEMKILLPILGNHYGRILEAGELIMERREGSFFIRYFDNVYPVAPRSLSGFLSRAGRIAGSPDLEFISSALEFLPLPTTVDRFSTRQRHRDKEVIRRQLSRLFEEQPSVRRVADEELALLNSDFDRLDAILDMQNYRLAYWRIARTDLGYRRFFDINSLAALRTEDEDVFRDIHSRIFEWLETGVLDGVRVDHPDGLRDPVDYLKRLRDQVRNAWIFVEKILEPGERLRSSWPVDGTTGYDFLNLSGNLFIKPEAETALTLFYKEFTEETRSYSQILRNTKQKILVELLGSDINRLTELTISICEKHRRYRDYSRGELKDAIIEIIVTFSVYRTYIRGDEGKEEDAISREDKRHVTEAVEAAKNNRKDIDPELFDFFKAILLLQVRGDQEKEFLLRLQQITGPAMAKGAEDTAFYIYNRFTPLNEVGGNPERFGISPEVFHDEMRYLQKEFPSTMLSTSTHDTKRSEDVRARLYCISEIPDKWREYIINISSIAEKYKKHGMPERNTEYLFYQTLVGAWPISRERVQEYMIKSVKEAKVYSSWVNPDNEYEEALLNFIRAIYKDEEICRQIEKLTGLISPPGLINSLGQTLLKLTCPGVPDIYQGMEIHAFTLVDPDNRRLVDFEKREKLLEKIESCVNPEEILENHMEGLPKLYLIKKVLDYRRKNHSLFGPDSAYKPLTIAGKNQNGTVSFLRRKGKRMCVTAIPRFNLQNNIGEDDSYIELPGKKWFNVFTEEIIGGGKVSLTHLYKQFPVAFLSGKDE
jgi:(1->4)-alpha-D-glucan 1-alpha-D-glucosylmutase